MKYISKEDTKHVYPKSCRIYGYGGVSPVVRRRVRFYRCSRSIRDDITRSGLTFADVDMRPCLGGKCDIVSGWYFPSLWKCILFSGVPVFFRCFDPDLEGEMLVDMMEKIGYYTLDEGV